jgi:RimJ/RimL family protein N-acetyltransferase
MRQGDRPSAPAHVDTGLVSPRPPEAWTTERLYLRPARVDDAQSLFEAYMSDETVTRYLMWSPHSHVDQARSFLRRCEQEWDDGTAFPWVIELGGRPVGMIEIGPYPGPGSFAVGYVLAREHWGKGIMPEALNTIVDWALDQPGVYRVWAVCDVDNRPSARVMEKVGMEFEGILRRYVVHPNIADEPRDARCYARVK